MTIEFIHARIGLVDQNGFIRRGFHRVSLRRLSETGRISHRDCSEEMRQNYIDMAMLDTPLVDVDGDEILITAAGRKALPGYQAGEAPK